MSEGKLPLEVVLMGHGRWSYAYLPEKGVTNPCQNPRCPIEGKHWYDPRESEATPAPPSGETGDDWYIETGWVLTKHDKGALWYIGVTDSGMLGWTDDNLKALRLARREDADKLAEICDDVEKVEEHQWCGPLAAPADTRKEFEEWARSEPEVGFNGKRNDHFESYVDYSDEVAWLAWQAAKEKYGR